MPDVTAGPNDEVLRRLLEAMTKYELRSHAKRLKLPIPSRSLKAEFVKGLLDHADRCAVLRQVGRLDDPDQTAAAPGVPWTKRYASALAVFGLFAGVSGIVGYDLGVSTPATSPAQEETLKKLDALCAELVRQRTADVVTEGGADRKRNTHAELRSGIEKAKEAGLTSAQLRKARAALLAVDGGVEEVLKLIPEEEALASFEDALASREDSEERIAHAIDKNRILGLALLNAERWEQAAAVFDRISLLNPTDGLARLAAAECFAKLQQWDRAIARYDEFVTGSSHEDGDAWDELVPMSAMERLCCALNSRGVTYGELNPPDRERQIADFTAVIDMGDAPADQRAKALCNRGSVYGKLDPPDREGQIADYTALIKMADAPPDQRAKALNNRGITYGQLKPADRKRQFADYATVIDMPDAPAAHRANALYNCAVAYGELEPPDREEQIVNYTALIKMADAPADKRARASYDRGNIYGQLDPPEREREMADFTAVIDMAGAPVDLRAKALFNRGVNYGKLNPPDRERQIADFTAVIDMADAPAAARARAFVNRGVTYGKLNPPDRESQIADYTAVIKMADAPAEPRARALYNRALRYLQLGDIERARVDLVATLEVNGAPSTVRRGAERLLRDLHDKR